MSHTPTDKLRERVESYAAVGIPQEDIARVLGIDAKTLRKHYRDDLDIASIKANATIGGALFNKAKGGDTASMIWWTKARMRWSERKEIQHSGSMDVTDESMSYEEAERIYTENLKDGRDDV